LRNAGFAALDDGGRETNFHASLLSR
jgi:hypothetical protein